MRSTSLFTAWLALVWERSVPVLWPVLAGLGVFAILSLLGLWDQVGDPWRALTAAGLIGLAVWLTGRGVSRFAWPTQDETARRVEEDSGIEARPHEALTDQPVEHDPLAQRIWQEHQTRMAARLADARARRPHAAWAYADRWALRGVLALFLATSWFIAGPAAQDRLTEAFSPSLILAGGETLSIDAWIDPPAYTGRPPVFLADGDRSAEIPAGSTFVTRIAGSRRAPHLTLRTGGDVTRTTGTEIGAGVWEARMLVSADSTLRLAAPGTRENWTLTAIPDNAPQIRLLAVPDATAAGELDLRFSAEDDYGVTSYAMEFRPEDDDEADWERLEIDPVSVAPLREGEGFSTLLETARHPLAGSRVTIRLIAGDAAGNEGLSPELGVTLPERVFLDALARAVAEQRRGVMEADAAYAPLPERPALYREDIPPGPAYLAEEPERRIERAPEGLQYAARALDAISDAPAYFFDDPVVYLGIRETVHRLRRSRDQVDLDGLESDLWNIALRAELGSLADAEAALRAAERALMEALARGADETELAALFEAYQQAMENYMAALAREAAEEGEFAEGGNGPQMDNAAIQEMLDALREAAELGDTADARQALAALSEMLRNMQIQLGQGSGEGDQPDPITEAMREALEELGEMIGEQRDLQDQTFGLNQQEQQSGGNSPSSSAGQPQGGQSGEGPQTMAENQSGGAQSAQQLADAQGQLAERFGQSSESVPGEGSQDTLGQAGEAMNLAEEALRQGDTEGALAAQEDALADLRAGAEELARELLERMEDGQGPGADGQDERDPLGRPAEGAFADGSGVDIPDEMSRARAREILQRLRDRAAQSGLTQEELDYIERLLDRF
ncbi:DUF4175 domain-containing protein [Maricaulis parjimensis]|uniref:DUF4175 domain-containing protein n=1 Tax=Maricaulis parjimensis TaxID=144023 RepID=UPI001939FEB1|nr:DUF4175 family protein [Maricaulis parjimensis]